VFNFDRLDPFDLSGAVAAALAPAAAKGISILIYVYAPRERQALVFIRCPVSQPNHGSLCSQHYTNNVQPN
jgi:hypothetical protein